MIAHRGCGPTSSKTGALWTFDSGAEFSVRSKREGENVGDYQSVEVHGVGNSESQARMSPGEGVVYPGKVGNLLSMGRAMTAGNWSFIWNDEVGPLLAQLTAQEVEELGSLVESVDGGIVPMIKRNMPM